MWLMWPGPICNFRAPETCVMYVCGQKRTHLRRDPKQVPQNNLCSSIWDARISLGPLGEVVVKRWNLMILQPPRTPCKTPQRNGHRTPNTTRLSWTPNPQPLHAISRPECFRVLVVLDLAHVRSSTEPTDLLQGASWPREAILKVSSFALRCPFPARIPHNCKQVSCSSSLPPTDTKLATLNPSPTCFRGDLAGHTWIRRSLNPTSPLRGSVQGL